MATLTLPASSARTVVRRLYFYGVALVSFMAALVALNILLQTLTAVWLDRAWLEVVDFTYVRDTVAAGGGLLLVATPIFLLHWGFAQRRADEEERRSALRKLFLYGASLVAVGYALYYSYELLQGLALLALGEPALSTPIWPSKWLADLLMVIAGTALQAYFHTILVQDGDYGAEIGGAGALRRLYQTLAGLVGLALVILGVGGVIETLALLLLEMSERTVGIGWWRSGVGSGIAQALVGALLVRINWMRWRTLAVRHPAEAQTALRRFYLYGSVVIGALA
ncbi:MAG TPA: DUF5671 domain-containing protein, partial [Caldilineaceae bacterium]|nr:DUF5671 domain-containing protein [Caldilineaceae bacterium]